MKLGRLTYIIAHLLFVVSCTTYVEDNTKNPFTAIDETTEDSTNFAPQSIQGIHRTIFAVKCANPTCHDGTFEPDFRTIESSYNSLVYHPVIKNDSLGSFTYRVVPKNLQESWLMERLLTDDPVLGRMPIYAPMLSEPELNDIRAWIMNGAPDVNGNPAQYPNQNAEVKYYVAYDVNSIRIDTNRTNGWSSAFVTNKNEDFNLLFKVTDDSTASTNLLVNNVKLSYNREDFSNAISLTAVYYTNSLWIVNITQGTVNANQQVYFRYYVRDPDHTDLTEYPRADMPYYYKDNASFIQQ